MMQTAPEMRERLHAGSIKETIVNPELSAKESKLVRIFRVPIWSVKYEHAKLPEDDGIGALFGIGSAISYGAMVPLRTPVV
mmetsp:Transcript_14992/g.30357  ORF Transcript_14992/g.30357 Transcript_14992/m.30357 type:complete len:81 (+) Transcript_14992:652-894(+)